MESSRLGAWLQRARAVRTFLIREGGVPGGLLTAVGYGASRPTAENSTPLGRQRNRRVELRIPRGGSPTRLTSEQLKINQRIAQEAVAGEDVTPGIDAARAASVPNPPRFVLPELDAPKVKISNIRATQRQLIINQRVSQATIRHLNGLIARVESGFSGADFQDGTLTAADLA